MATDPRAALAELTAALRAHLDAALADQDPDSDAVLDAAAVVADAFDAYDDALYDATGVDTSFLLDDDEDDDEDEDDEDDESEEDSDDEDSDDELDDPLADEDDEVDDD